MYKTRKVCFCTIHHTVQQLFSSEEDLELFKIHKVMHGFDFLILFILITTYWHVQGALTLDSMDSFEEQETVAYEFMSQVVFFSCFQVC